MSAAQGISWRILVGAGSFADAQSALQLVERLVGPRLTELGGVFLEEEALAEIAELPRQRVVTPGGALMAAPSRRQLGVLLERDAEAFRKMLSGVAQSRKWGFQRRRGDLIGSLCKAAKGWDILLVGYHVARKSRGPVVLIAPPPETSRRAAELAGELAHVLGTDLLSLDLFSGRTAWKPGQKAAENFDDAEALLSRLSRIPAAALVVDSAAAPFQGTGFLRRLHLAARCPMIIFGAGRGDAAIEKTA